MLRSESMSLYQLLIPRESSYDVMSELGGIESVMMIDQQFDQLNKPFINQVQRCDEILHKCEYLVKQLFTIGIMLDHVFDFQYMLQQFELALTKKMGQRHTFLNEIEESINNKYTQIQQQIDTLAKLKSRHQFLNESKYAMISARRWFGDAYFMSKSSTALDFDLLQSNLAQKFTHFVGIIDSVEYPILQKTVFRITKGNYMIQHETLQDNDQRTCFLLIFPCFSMESTTWSKIKKISEVLKVDHVSLPTSEDQWDDRFNAYDKEIDEVSHTEQLTQQLLISILKPLNQGIESQNLQFIRFYLIRERTLYENLNKLRMQQSIFIAEMWVRTNEINLIEEIINTIKQKNPNTPAPQFRNIVQTTKSPPTFFKANQFNKIFQLITETYGIPSYKEINPSIFVIVTFPFLFGVMFGDIAHGLGILTFGLYLSFTKKFSPRSQQRKLRHLRIQQQEQKKAHTHNDEDLNDSSDQQIIYDLRYMFILCGIFATYCGLIYNEYFGFPLDIFSSNDDSIYPFGVDPKYAEDMSFTNSMKMKLAIIIGFCQMTLGLCCMGLNSFYFKDWISLIIIFPAKLLFFTCFIGYMVYLILLKWLTPWPNTALAPSIITTMVEMWMHNGSVSLHMSGSPQEQEDLQKIIMALCAICVPIILLVPMFKEIHHNNSHNKRKQMKKNNNQVQEFEMVEGNEEQVPKEQEQEDNETPITTMDIVVGCFIETMEFVLGCISNTASYLRLWALSLAHSQLAQVLFSLTLSDGITNSSLFQTIFFLPAFLIATFGILLCMDAMECFLHSLRLHWVEFQNKFFKGNGYLFQVYSFRCEMQKYQEKLNY